MKIAITQHNFQIADFSGNTQKIIQTIQSAKTQGAELVIFPELAVSGYPPRDFLEFESFTDQCYQCILEIADICRDVAAIIGSPYKNTSSRGKKVFNSAFFIENGKIKNIIHKTLLPAYDVFDECRYFESNKKFEIIEYQNKRIAITICEDIWDIHTPYYGFNPMDKLIKFHPDLMVNIAASPFSFSHNQDRLKVLRSNAAKYKIPIFYSNHVGAHTELIFDGGSAVISDEGEHVIQLPFFEESIFIINTDDPDKIPTQANIEYDKNTLIYKALIMGIRDFFSKLNFHKAILGLSGGIDSALVATLLSQALGFDKVKALLLPSPFSSDHSIRDSILLAENLGIEYEIIPISNIYNQCIAELYTKFSNHDFGITEENIQARIRALILMAYSNKEGYILINTSNKSEMAVGYGTLYGDMCGGLSIIGDLYKTEVYQLAKYINSVKKIIPENILTKAPSAELRPNQKDSDSLPDYETLDKILFQYIEGNRDAMQIISNGFDPLTVRKVINLVNNSEHKRFQAPPVLRVSSKAFGPGRRMPIVAKYKA